MPAPPNRTAALPPDRRWLAPAIASLLAGVVLVALVFGHLLRYPADTRAARDAADVEAQRQTNQALRDQLDRLRAAANVCQMSPRQSADVQPVLPPLPTQTPVSVVGTGEQKPAVSTLAGLLDKATVLVLAGDSLGSGFFISDRDIVTNHHVIGQSHDVRVGNKALGGFVSARVVAVGTGDGRGTQDLAVLEIAPKPGTAFLQLGVVPGRLEPLIAAGYPGAVLATIQDGSGSALPEANFTQGILTSRQVQSPAGIGTIIHTAQIGHGNSGGPLVDAGGCAVGVNSWMSVDVDQQVVFSTFFQALDATELKTFLKTNAIGFTAADATCKPVRPPVPGNPGDPPGGPLRVPPGQP